MKKKHKEVAKVFLFSRPTIDTLYIDAHLCVFIPGRTHKTLAQWAFWLRKAPPLQKGKIQ